MAKNPGSKVASAEKPGETLARPDGSAETVTVACKMPNGMLLQLCEPMEIQQPVLGGGMKTVTEYKPMGQIVKIHGPAVPFGAERPCRVVMGYALTEGVDKAFFDAWLEQHAQDHSVVNKIIFAHTSAEYVRDFAKDHRTVTSGLEPLKTENDPRAKVGAKINPADEMAGRTQAA